MIRFAILAAVLPAALVAAPGPLSPAKALGAFQVEPGARVRSGNNWWQGMVQEDPNGNWVDGPGRVTCFLGQTAPADKITYPVVCRGSSSPGLNAP